MLNQDYITIIKEIMQDWNKSYFTGHKERFIVALNMFHKFLDNEEIKSVYDLGTSFPFVSHYFNLTQEADVVFGSMNLNTYLINDKVKYININLIETPKMEQVDLVMCLECLEHLPCNLYRIRQYLCELVKKGKYLLLSFPLNGKNAKGYEEEIPYNKDEKNFQPHIREFTPETAIDFCKGTGMEIVKDEAIFVEAYGGNIMTVLMRKI